MTSLRTTVALALLAMLVAIGALASVFAHQATLYETGQFMDDQMRQVAAVVDERTSPRPTGALQEPEDRYAVSVWTKDHRPIVLAPPAMTPEPETTGFSTKTIAGEPWRMYAVREDGRSVLVAQRISARTESADHAALMVALPILASGPFVWLVVFATVRRALRPLTDLGTEIASRGPQSFRPLPTTALPDEVRPFVVAIEGLVDRLRDSLERERRFVADAAHQLRTPLAALALQVDNLDDPRLAIASRDALREGVRRIAKLTDQLLDLAKLDGSPMEARAREVDLAALLTQGVADRIVLAEAGELDLGLTMVETATAILVADDLALILANVIDNAVLYTPRGGRIDCSLRRSDGYTARIDVEDTGLGVAEHDLSHLTDRFYRGSLAAGHGSGLGLSIAKAAAERNGLKLVIANRREGGLSVGILIPLAISCSESGRSRRE